MNAFHDLTATQLRHVIHLKGRIEYLQGLLASLRDGSPDPTKKKVGHPRAASRRATHQTKAKPSHCEEPQHCSAKTNQIFYGEPNTAPPKYHDVTI